MHRKEIQIKIQFKKNIKWYENTQDVNKHLVLQNNKLLGKWRNGTFDHNIFVGH